MLKAIKSYQETATNIVTTANSAVIDVRRAKLMSVQAVVTVGSPSAKTFVDGNVNTTTDKITITGHAFATGLKVALTNSGGTVPGGLSQTNYFVIVIDANTIQLSSSLANALAGTQVDITSAAGGGTDTLTPASLTTATIILQKSNDYNINTGAGTFDAIGSATSITTTADIWLSATDPEYQFVRIQTTLAAGILSSAVYNVCVKGDL